MTDIASLTREEAAERAALVNVQRYDVHLDLRGLLDGDVWAATSTVSFTCTEPGAATFVDCVGEVASVTLNGRDLDPATAERGRIPLPDLEGENVLVVSHTQSDTRSGTAILRTVDPNDKLVYVWSTFEPDMARFAFACFDQPDLKAPHGFVVDAHESWTVTSNSAPDRVEELSDGGRRWTFGDTPPLSTYVTVVNGGPFHELRSTRGGHDLGLFGRQSLRQFLERDAEELFDLTERGLTFFGEQFGQPFPQERYDQVFVPNMGGAMENWGSVTWTDSVLYRSTPTYGQRAVRAQILLHEMAHMWFGDLVTMRWWDDLWLNESFATFASVLAQASDTEYEHAWTTFANIEKSWAYRQDQLPSTHPVAADIPDLQAVEVNFDGITYAKGAAVLKQLYAYVGPESFLAGLKVYFAKHAWGNATLADLLTALEEASGRDLSGWGAQWLQTTGLNLLRPRFSVAADGTFADFVVLQGPARPGAGELRAHRLAIGVYDFDDAGKLVRRHRVELDVVGERTEVPDLVGVPAGKLVLVNDDDLTYCTMRLDNDSLATLLEHIADIAEPLPRTLCWSAAWEMTREAELKARDFVHLVLRGLHAESEVGVVQRLIQQAQVALSSYADRAWAPTGWSQFGHELLSLATAAEPGSDHQLAFVNALCSSVLDDDILAHLRDWLDGSPLPGLTVDTDLRWRLLRALAAHGKADLAAIGAELERDATAAGHRQSEWAKSLRPTAEAKAEAWRRAVADDDLPNAVSDAIIAGFSHPGQKALLEPYVARYFADVAGVWERRSSERAQPTVVGLFPAWSVNQTTVDAANAWLAEDRPPALRRLVSEGRAGIVRALAAQEFDRS
ncbi:MAG TPA: aminopeptidase N [Pseudonocardiaceae bacterium]|nr:aminopeptidase N [Pseudonocardiaceae bacterium]